MIGYLYTDGSWWYIRNAAGEYLQGADSTEPFGSKNTAVCRIAEVSMRDVGTARGFTLKKWEERPQA